jgi:PIN domain nuclease of toxin-antitoxin system
MRLLLDTHAFLWFVLNDPALSPTARALIADGENEVFVSPATYWELAIKISLGKYSLSEEFDAFFTHQLAHNDFAILPIKVQHAATLSRLPFHHRDPFDRMLVAQAMSEGLALVSGDDLLSSYSATILW